jgi:glycosyltransferase involved in cell wall biosynthesis
MARIVHVCPRYTPARGGVELFFSKLGEALVRAGHEVSVWTTDASTVGGFTSSSGSRLPRGPEIINAVAVRRFPVRYVPAQRYVRTAAHCLPFGTRWQCDTLRWTPWVPGMTAEAGRVSTAVDVVHATALPYSSILFAGVRLADRTGARLIMSPFTHIAPPGPRGARMRRAYLSPLNVHLLSRADSLFVQTELESRTLSEAGIPAGRQRIVGLGVDATDCSGGDRERTRRAWGVGNDEVVVGHLANKSWDKGTVDLLDAAEALWERGASFSLVLAGSQMPSFAARWSRVRFRERVVNLGELSEAERRDFFAAIDVFALPSYVESFGVSSLEAALTGSAVVVYDHGGPSQIFHHEVDALLVPVGDAQILAESLRVLTTDAAERARLAAGGARTAATYSWSRALGAALADYDALLRLPRGA